MLSSLKVLLVPLWIAALAIIFLASRQASPEGANPSLGGAKSEGGQPQLAAAAGPVADSSAAAPRYRTSVLAACPLY